MKFLQEVLSYLFTPSKEPFYRIYSILKMGLTRTRFLSRRPKKQASSEVHVFSRVVLPLILLLSFSFSAHAVEKVLCELTSDIDSDIGKIVYEMDSDNRGFAHLYMDTFVAGKHTKRVELLADKLVGGIVLNKKDDRIVVRIHSSNFDNDSGGILNLDTLYSGITGARKAYEIQVALDPSGPVLMTNKKRFTRMKFVGHRSMFLGVIGIERILFN